MLHIPASSARSAHRSAWCMPSAIQSATFPLRETILVIARTSLSWRFVAHIGFQPSSSSQDFPFPFPKKTKMQFSVRYLKTGELCVVDVPEYATIAGLNAAVAALIESDVLTSGNVSLRTQDGKALADEQTTLLADCNVSAGDQLDVVRLISDEERYEAATLVDDLCTVLPDDMPAALQRILFLDPENSAAWQLLANTPHLWNKVSVDGTLVSRSEACRRTLSLTPTHPQTLFSLSCCITPGDTITLYDGSIRSKIELLIECIVSDPHFIQAYGNLGVQALPFGSVSIEGEKWTNVRLYRKTIALRPKKALAYYALATVLQHSDEVELEDGRRMTMQQLLLEALKRSEQQHLASLISKVKVALAGTIPSSETLLIDNRPTTRKQLFKEAVNEMPRPTALLCLALQMPRDGMVRLKRTGQDEGEDEEEDEEEVSKVTLMERAFEYNERFASLEGWPFFPRRGRAFLRDGSFLEVQELCERQVRLKGVEEVEAAEGERRSDLALLLDSVHSVHYVRADGVAVSSGVFALLQSFFLLCAASMHLISCGEEVQGLVVDAAQRLKEVCRCMGEHLPREETEEGMKEGWTVLPDGCVMLKGDLLGDVSEYVQGFAR